MESDAVMCISNYTKSLILEQGIKPKSIVVIPLGVAKDHLLTPPQANIDAVLHRFNVTLDRPIILYTGWLIARKGPQILVKALSHIRKLDWHAIFVGPDHGCKGSLIQQAVDLGLYNRVKISDAIPIDELYALYNLASIFIFPTMSNDEGFGLVALEAMAHGLPIIASNVGAIPEVVENGKTGLLFQAGDDKGLAEKIEHLLQSIDLRKTMSGAGIQKAKELSWRKTAEKLSDLYHLTLRKYA